MITQGSKCRVSVDNLHEAVIVSKDKKKITKSMILRSVASSTAIETGATVKTIEKRLKANKLKYESLSLAI